MGTLKEMLATHNGRMGVQECTADGILGVRMLLMASRGVCPFKGGSNCSMHALLGTAVTAASVADLALAFIFSLFFERVLTRLETNTRKVRSQLLGMNGVAPAIHGVPLSLIHI